MGWEMDMSPEPEEEDIRVQIVIDEDDQVKVILVYPDGEVEHFGRDVVPSKIKTSISLAANQWDVEKY
jgi:hypothetical protein